MILLWFILGTVLIFGIARYNESNKLFWTLLFAFVMGFAGAKMMLDINGGNEQSNVNLTQVCSTQATVATLNTLPCYITNVVPQNGKVVTVQHLVSQGITPALSEKNVILSGISERTRDQPLLKLIKPPELCLQKDFSILHDTG
jgi:hypothetical protein